MNKDQIWRVAAEHMIRDLADEEFCVGDPKCYLKPDQDCRDCIRNYYLAVARYELDVAELKCMTFAEVLKQFGGTDD